MMRDLVDGHKPVDAGQIGAARERGPYGLQQSEEQERHNDRRERQPGPQALAVRFAQSR